MAFVPYGFVLVQVQVLVDRYRDLVEIPAPTRENPCGGLHHFAPDDEGAFEYENFDTFSTTALTTTPTSLVGGLCFDACFSQLCAFVLRGHRPLPFGVVKEAEKKKPQESGQECTNEQKDLRVVVSKPAVIMASLVLFECVGAPTPALVKRRY
jgi:hypothetical protein